MGEAGQPRVELTREVFRDVDRDLGGIATRLGARIGRGEAYVAVFATIVSAMLPNCYRWQQT